MLFFYFFEWFLWKIVEAEKHLLKIGHILCICGPPNYMLNAPIIGSIHFYQKAEKDDLFKSYSTRKTKF